MTKSEALKRSIEIAVERGFTWQLIWSGLPVDATYEILSGDENIVFKHKNISPEYGWVLNFKTLLFDHQFAKALFGEEEIIFRREPLKEHYESRRSGSFGRIVHIADWQYHLQQMVLYEDPLDYLVEYLGKEKE